MEGNQTLDNFKVGSLPTLIYIPDFITENEETILLKNIYDAPVSKWKSLKNRRLQNWGGVVHEKGLISQDLPSWLTKITCRISEESGLFPSPINHVLINEYLPNQGIMAHQDGPAYYPVVAILSLGSPVVMNFIPHSRLTVGAGNAVYSNSDVGISETHKSLHEHPPFPVLLMPHSLLIFKDIAYSDYLHAIHDSEVQHYDKDIYVNGPDRNELRARGIRLDWSNRNVPVTAASSNSTRAIINSFFPMQAFYKDCYYGGLTLENTLGDATWLAQCTSERSNGKRKTAIFGDGWKSFWVDNRLEERDVLVFERIDDVRYRVSINRVQQ